MRLVDSFDVPDELELARARGELVVFAGAGVSMGAPALLPDFKDLAKDIAKGSIGWDEDRDSRVLDQYLGRAAKAGVHVQDRARLRLAAPRAHNNEHEYLLGLFDGPDAVKLVTTNFDCHFSSAAKAVFPSAEIPRYVGPALPPGKSFRGIAQIHGALDRPLDALVLTDADFADAYMADGWASRFLTRVFADRTVLFVGYSLSDPLLRYLLRAVPSEGRWYALWHEDTPKTNDLDGIKRVTFKSSVETGKWGLLKEGLQRWYWYSRASRSEHDRELRRVVSNGPPTSPIELDYLRARLRNEEGRTAFFASAEQVEWLSWALGEGYLNVLFDSSADSGESSAWGRWALQRFGSGNNPALLGVVRARSLRLHPAFASELLRFIWPEKPIPDESVTRQWVALLTAQVDPVRWSLHGAEWLLDTLVDAKHFEAALAWLQFLVHPALQIVEKLQLAYEDDEDGAVRPLRALANRVELRLPSADLMHALSTKAKLLAHARPLEVLQLGERALGDAYSQLELARGDQELFDTLNFGVDVVGDSQGLGFAHAEDVLVAIVFAALEALRNNDDRLTEFVERHAESHRELFKRLAMFAASCCSEAVAAKVLDISLRARWASCETGRPEFAKVLAKHFLHTREPKRTAYIEVSLQQFAAALPDEEVELARFALAKMLARAAPRSRAAREFFAAQRAVHPDWTGIDTTGESRRVRVTSGMEEPSPVEAAEMLTWSGELAAANLVRLSDAADGRIRVGALLGAAQQAARADTAWGVELLLALLSSPGETDQASEAVFWVLREQLADRRRQLEVVSAFTSRSRSVQLLRAFGSACNKWADQLGPGEHESDLEAFNRAGDYLIVESEQVEPGVSQMGWTEAALNHPAGNAANVWWRVANARDRVGEAFVLSLDDEERARWDAVCWGTSRASAFARPIVGMLIERLVGGDTPWATTRILPAFDLQRGAAALQLWDGRLSQTRWSFTTARALLPYLPGVYTASADVLAKRADGLGDLIAFFVLSELESGFGLTQLQEFSRSASIKSRVSFAHSIARRLDGMDEEAKRRLWCGTLQPYWRDRTTGVPRVIEKSELESMFDWVPGLGASAAEALDLLTATPGTELEHVDSLVHEWKSTPQWAIDNPTVAVGIIRFLAARRSLNPWMAPYAVEVLAHLRRSGAPWSLLKAAAEDLLPLTRSAADFLDAK